MSKVNLSFVDWNSLVKMPANVAFKGYNGKYIRDWNDFLQLASEDPNNETSGFKVELRADGHVQIRPAAPIVMFWGLSWAINP